MSVLDLIPERVIANLSLDGASEKDIAAEFLRIVSTDEDVAARFKQAFADVTPDSPYPVPLVPSLDAYAPREGVPAGLSMSVGPNGEVEGRFFEWGVCVIGASSPGNCVTPMPSPDGYNAYHQGSTNVMDSNGDVVKIPTGGMALGHSHPTDSFEASITHYNDVANSMFTARAYDDDLGGYFRGSMKPGATYADVAAVEAAATSGHWGYIEGYTRPNGSRINSGWQCYGPCAVIRPAAPLVREHVTLEPVTASLSGDTPKQLIGTIRMATEEDLKIGLPTVDVEKPACGCSDKEPEPEVTASLDAESQQRISAQVDSNTSNIEEIGRLVAEIMLQLVADEPTAGENVNA